MTTIERQEDLILKKDCDNNVNKMSEKIDKIGDKVNNIEVQLAGLPEALHEKFIGTFASKLTEKIVYGIVTLMLVAVSSSIVYLVVRPKHEINDRMQALEDLINNNFQVE